MAVCGIGPVPMLQPQCSLGCSRVAHSRCLLLASQIWGTSLGLQTQLSRTDQTYRRCYVSARKPEVPQRRVVKRLLEALQQQDVNVQKVLREKGPCINPNDWFLVLDDVGKQRRWLLALEIFRWMQLQKWYKPDHVHYWKLVFIMGKEKELRLAMALFAEMEQKGLLPNTPIYNAIIAAHVAMSDVPGNLEKAVTLFEEMKERKRKASQPDIVTYNTLIKAFAHVGDFRRVHSLFDELHMAGLQPVVHTFNLIIGAYGKEAAHVDRMEHMYGLMMANKCRPDSFTLNTLLQAYCKAAEFERAEVLLALMIKSKKTPADEKTFNSLIDGYGQSGLVAKMEEVAEKLIDAGFAPSAITFEIMIGAYGRAGSFDRMRECVQAMKIAQFKPSYATCHFIVEALCDSKLFDWAEEAANDAFLSGLTIDDSLYTVVLKAYALEGRSEDIEHMLCRMDQVGVPFDRAVLMDLLGFYTKDSKRKAKGIGQLEIRGNQKTGRKLTGSWRELRQRFERTQPSVFQLSCGMNSTLQ